MKIAILILAHKNKEQLEFLINNLQHPSFMVYLHLDGTADFGYEEIQANFKPVVPRHRCSWGSHGVTKATFDLLRLAFKDKNDYYLLISGQCFPVKPLDYILEYFVRNEGKSFMHMIPFPAPYFGANGANGRSRFSYFHMPKVEGANWMMRLKYSLFYRLKQLQKKGYIALPVPGDLYGGENWFNLHHSVIKVLLPCYKEDTFLRWRCSFALLTEEIVPHTLIKRNKLDENFIYNSLRFTRWVHPSDHPQLITSEDFNDIYKSNALFARKFEGVEILRAYLSDRKKYDKVYP